MAQVHTQTVYTYELLGYTATLINIGISAIDRVTRKQTSCILYVIMQIILNKVLYGVRLVSVIIIIYMIKSIYIFVHFPIWKLIPTCMKELYVRLVNVITIISMIQSSVHSAEKLTCKLNRKAWCDARRSYSMCELRKRGFAHDVRRFYSILYAPV